MVEISFDPQHTHASALDTCNRWNYKLCLISEIVSLSEFLKVELILKCTNVQMTLFIILLFISYKRV